MGPTGGVIGDVWNINSDGLRESRGSAEAMRGVSTVTARTGAV